MKQYPDVRRDLADLLLGASDEEDTPEPIIEVRFGHLSELHIASPCSAKWDEMAGDEKIRHCSECRLDVHNLSAMTEQEAAGLFSSHAELPCVRFYQRTDGTILFQDCPEGLAHKTSEDDDLVFMGRPGPFGWRH
jgi:hypothetical protein